jgi:E3 ubiquitin-protein ligase HUWE1
MEDVHYAPQDEMGDEGLEGDDDVEMEYADETGSEDTSHSDDEDAQLDAPALDDNWVDEEDGDASNLMENEEDAQEDMDGGEDGEDEDDGEDDEDDARAEAGIWQVWLLITYGLRYGLTLVRSIPTKRPKKGLMQVRLMSFLV